MSENTKLVIGGILAAGGLLVGALGLTVDRAADPLPPIVVTATPLPETPLYTCPPGWSIPEGNADEHGVVFACVNGDWTVILRSDQTFSHGWNKNGGGFVLDPAGVPGWPD